MKSISKKLVVIGVICVFAIGTVVFSKVKPLFEKKASNPPGLTYNPSNPESALAVLRSKINTTPLTPLEDPGTSLTDQLSHDFAYNLVSMQQTGEEDPELIDKLTAYYATTSSVTLSLSHISTFPDTDKVKVKEFGNLTAKTILNHNSILKNSPLDILAEAESKKMDAQMLIDELAPIAKAYRMLALELQKIPAPESQKQTYLDIINGYIKLGDDVENMSYFFADPIRSFLGVNNYQNNFVIQLDLLKNTTNYFDSNAILFNETEDGRIWSSLK